MRIINRAGKGRRREHQSRRYLEAQGYTVLRAAASKGIFDLVAVGSADVLLVQCKSNSWPRGDELSRLWAFKCPPNVRRVIHRWRDREAAPDIKELI